MIPDFIQNNSKVLKIIGLVVVLFIAGTLVALFLPSSGTVPVSEGEIPTGKQNPLFSDLRLGTPVRPEFATQKNPPIKQKSEYTVGELIMLQGTTTQSATGPVEVTVRLVDDKSAIHSLSPSTITLPVGTNTFCCWAITTPGRYTMQIFRPDSIVTRIPLIIAKEFNTTKPK